MKREHLEYTVFYTSDLTGKTKLTGPWSTYSAAERSRASLRDAGHDEAKIMVRRVVVGEWKIPLRDRKN